MVDIIVNDIVGPGFNWLGLPNVAPSVFSMLKRGETWSSDLGLNVPTQIVVKYYTSKTQFDSYTFNAGANRYRQVQNAQGATIGAYVVMQDIRTHLPKFSKMYEMAITKSDGDVIRLVFRANRVFSLSNPTTVQSQTVAQYLRSHSLTGSITRDGAARYRADLNASFFNDSALWAVSDIEGLTGKNETEFPYLLTGRQATYTGTGTYGAITGVRFKIGVWPNTVNSGTSDFLVLTVDSLLPPPVIENIPQAERARTSLTSWQKVQGSLHVSALLRQIPDIRNADILRIEAVSSNNANLSSPNKRTYQNETSDNRYQFQIHATNATYMRLEIVKNDGNKVLTPVYIVKLVNDVPQVNTVSEVNSLFRTIPTSVKKVRQTAIDFRVESDLLLDERLSQVRIYIAPNRQMLKATYVNTGDNPWAELALTGLTHSTKYTAYFTYTWLGIEIDAYSIAITTIPALQSVDANTQTKTQAVDEVLIQNLPNEQYQFYKVMDFDTRLNIAEGILAQKVNTVGNTGGIDQNPNNANAAQKGNRANSVFSKETGTTVQDILADAVLTVPEPNEDTDLYQEPYQ